jgi:hypothetical protein
MLCYANFQTRTTTYSRNDDASSGEFYFSFRGHLYQYLLELGGVQIMVCLLFDVEASDPPVELVDIVGLLSAGLL